jgi:hypothetical protein
MTFKLLTLLFHHLCNQYYHCHTSLIMLLLYSTGIPCSRKWSWTPKRFPLSLTPKVLLSLMCNSVCLNYSVPFRNLFYYKNSYFPVFGNYSNIHEDALVQDSGKVGNPLLPTYVSFPGLPYIYIYIYSNAWPGTDIRITRSPSQSSVFVPVGVPASTTT